jgi:hypothetical protein
MPARRVVLHAVAILVLLAAVLAVAGCAIPAAAVRNPAGKPVIRYQGWPGTVLWQELADDVRAKFLDIIRGRHRAESTEAVQYYLSSTVPAKGGVMQPQEFQVWIDRLVRTGVLKVGQVQTADVYTNEFNPYSADAGQGARL